MSSSTNRTDWKLWWAMFLGFLDIVAFLFAFFLYFKGEYAQAAFWLALSISMELSTARAFRRAAGKESF